MSLEKKFLKNEFDTMSLEDRFANREVIIEDVDGIDYADYPDFCDAYCTAATWEDGKELTDDELDYLNEEYREEVYEVVLKQAF